MWIDTVSWRRAMLRALRKGAGRSGGASQRALATLAFSFCAALASGAGAPERPQPQVKWVSAAWTDKISGDRFQTSSATVAPNKDRVGAFVVIGRTNDAPYDLTITLEHSKFHLDQGSVVLQIKVDDAPPVKVKATYVDPLNSRCAFLGSPPGLVSRMIKAKSIKIRARTSEGSTDLMFNGPGKLNF